MPSPSHDQPLTAVSVRMLVGALLANGVAGLLYVWSLFILPIEAAFALGRAELGLISSLSLISFTAGVAFIPFLLNCLGRTGVSLLGFGLIAGGHLSFGMWASWIALAAGYGVAFGLGSGIAYGLALSLAAALPERQRALAIGLVMGAFALSGIVLPLVLGSWIAETNPSNAFFVIGLSVAGAGIVAALVVPATPLSPACVEKSSETQEMVPQKIDRAFWILSLIFFFLCFEGLIVVSQAAAIADAAGIANVAAATSLFTIGYLVGSLLGAPTAARIGERVTLILLSVVGLLGAVAIFTASAGMVLSGAATIGATFGGSGSIMPVLLGKRYGPANISRLYGRMMIAYGLAGLLAPSLAGFLFQAAGSYSPSLGLCVLCALLAATAALALPRRSLSG